MYITVRFQDTADKEKTSKLPEKEENPSCMQKSEKSKKTDFSAAIPEARRQRGRLCLQNRQEKTPTSPLVNLSTSCEGRMKTLAGPRISHPRFLGKLLANAFRCSEGAEQERGVHGIQKEEGPSTGKSKGLC